MEENDNTHKGLDGYKKMEMQQAFDELIDFVYPVVTQQKTYYDEAVKQGFSKREALESSIGFVRSLMAMGGKND